MACRLAEKVKSAYPQLLTRTSAMVPTQASLRAFGLPVRCAECCVTILQRSAGMVGSPGLLSALAARGRAARCMPGRSIAAMPTPLAWLDGDVRSAPDCATPRRVERWCFTLTLSLGSKLKRSKAHREASSRTMVPVFFCRPPNDAPRGEMSLLCREPIFGDHREVKSRYYVG
jgi:hypothetical protein